MVNLKLVLNRSWIYLAMIGPVLLSGPRVRSVVGEESTISMDRVRMAAVIKFADTVLIHGRDRYGSIHSPLFVDQLNVDTMRAPDRTYINRLNKPSPRQWQPWQPVISSNLAYQCNLARTLTGLSHLTGAPKYKEAYQEAIRYCFENYQTESGLLHMGHHRFIDLVSGKYDGDDWPPGSRGHEMKGDMPYYDLFWETDAESTRRMLAGHWNSHLKNWVNMDFTRHGRYHKRLESGVWDRPLEEPVKGIIQGDLTFFDSATDILWAGGKLSQLNQDQKPRLWTERLLARYIDSSHPETGLPPFHHTQARDLASGFRFPHRDWQEYSLLVTNGSSGPPDFLFASGATMLMRLSELLADEGTYFRDSVSSYLKAYAKHAYRVSDNTFRPIHFNGTDLSSYRRPGSPAYNMSSEGRWPPCEAHSGYLLSFALCYRLTHDPEIWETLRGIVRGNDLGELGESSGQEPRLKTQTSQDRPLAIFALVELFRATNQRAYLDAARLVANNAFAKRFDEEKGLFVASDLHKHANLNVLEPLAFLTLEAALRDQIDNVPTYDGTVAAIGSDGVLRPVSALPYQPTASVCWYAHTVDAMCDGLIPENSQDSSIPQMSWFRSQHTESVTAVFPDVLTEPIEVAAPNDAEGTSRLLNGVMLDSPFSYTFVGPGSLKMNTDFKITVLQGEHIWQDVTLYPAISLNYVLDISAGSEWKFTGQIYEYYSHGNRAGIVKNGGGTVVVTGDYLPIYKVKDEDNRAYRGDTVVNEGLLLVNNSKGTGVSPRSTIHINENGVLGGDGTIGTGQTEARVHIHSGGMLSPGTSVGTLTLKDGLTLNEGARLRFDVGSRCDLIRVEIGALDCSQAKRVLVECSQVGRMEVGETYDLIDWSLSSSSGVNADKFVLVSEKIDGRFSVQNNRLRLTIVDSLSADESDVISDSKQDAETPEAEKLLQQSHGQVKRYRWIASRRGDWQDRGNWQDNEIPNGPRWEWAQYRFLTPRLVSRVDLYWLDDNGQILVPKSWRVFYRKAGKWKLMNAKTSYGVAKDQWNEVLFEPVVTDGLRLQAEMQPNFSGGILEWRIYPTTTDPIDRSNKTQDSRE